MAIDIVAQPLILCVWRGALCKDVRIFLGRVIGCETDLRPLNASPEWK